MSDDYMLDIYCTLQYDTSIDVLEACIYVTSDVKKIVIDSLYYKEAKTYALSIKDFSIQWTDLKDQKLISDNVKNKSDTFVRSIRLRSFW
jgi:hypothetical protein